MNSAVLEAFDRLQLNLNRLAGSVEDLRGALAQLPPDSQSTHPLKLHEAMAAVLLQRGNEWTKVSALAAAINEQDLYRRGDRAKLTSNQLHARVNRPTYRDMFDKQGPFIRLAEGAARSQGRGDQP